MIIINLVYLYKSFKFCSKPCLESSMIGPESATIMCHILSQVTLVPEFDLLEPTALARDWSASNFLTHMLMFVLISVLIGYRHSTRAQVYSSTYRNAHWSANGCKQRQIAPQQLWQRHCRGRAA